MARRMGPQDSATSNAILDAAEHVLQTRGYGAITSRSVAEAAGVRQQLIYYYFQTVDEMLLVAFKRRTARGIERLKQDVASEQPIRALWDDFNNAFDARLTFEYMALANHHDGIREEVAKFMHESRVLQIEQIRKAYSERDIDPDAIPPEAVVFLISAISMLMVREAQTGVSITHKEVHDMVERFLRQFD